MAVLANGDMGVCGANCSFKKTRWFFHAGCSMAYS
jgi:hypothetical protein